MQAVFRPRLRILQQGLLALLLALAGLAAVPSFGQDLYPTFKERDVFADWALPPGSGASEEKRIVTAGSSRRSDATHAADAGSRWR